MLRARLTKELKIELPALRTHEIVTRDTDAMSPTCIHCDSVCGCFEYVVQELCHKFSRKEFFCKNCVEAYNSLKIPKNRLEDISLDIFINDLKKAEDFVHCKKKLNLCYYTPSDECHCMYSFHPDQCLNCAKFIVGPNSFECTKSQEHLKLSTGVISKLKDQIPSYPCESFLWDWTEAKYCGPLELAKIDFADPIKIYQLVTHKCYDSLKNFDLIDIIHKYIENNFRYLNNKTRIVCLSDFDQEPCCVITTSRGKFGYSKSHDALEILKQVFPKATIEYKKL